MPTMTPETYDAFVRVAELVVGYYGGEPDLKHGERHLLEAAQDALAKAKAEA